MISYPTLREFRLYGLWAHLLLSAPVFAKPDTPDFFFDCVGTGTSSGERKNIRTAPFGVKRLDKNRLEIRWKTGSRIYADAIGPDSDDDPFALNWRYCGYVAQLGYHLIQKNTDPFTGVLVNAKTGEELPGGQAVHFSFAHKQYLAYEQHDGMDGSNMVLYDFNGVELWHGYSGILHEGVIVAGFDAYRWDTAGRLQAAATCVSEQKPATWLTLVDTSQSWYVRAKAWIFSTGWPTDTPSWEWQPKLKCPKPKW